VPDLSLQLLALLFAAAFLAGFVDSIAGGGGLISVPAMLIAGIPPLQTLGTNKVQSICGSGSATLAYARRGHVKLSEQLPMAVMAMIGGAIGALLATIIPADVLRIIMPFLLIAIALYFAFKPNITDVETHRRMRAMTFGLTLVPAVGLYDGAFGPNLGALVVFVFSGVILWKLGILMGIGQFLGAQLGSRLAMRIGGRVIKPLLVVVCLAFAVKLLADPANPVRVWLGI
jgi:uncharacterized membrane protein YfcA